MYVLNLIMDRVNSDRVIEAPELYRENLIRAFLGLPIQMSDIVQEYIANLQLELHAIRLDEEYK